MRRSVRTTALLAIAALVVISFSGVQTASSDIESDSLTTGPYVDEVIYKDIPNQDQRILALLAGDIEMDNSFFNPSWYAQLDADPDIDIFNASRNGYGHITINCAKYPLNISGFRRAFAFAFDKTRVTSEILDGFSIEHDSLVPQPNGWCVEDQFDWHYYTAQPDIGNQILDDLGFEVNETSGFRLAPDGTSFDIVIEYSASSQEIARGFAQIGVDALLRLGIDARTGAADFNEYISRLDNHGDYDMVYYAVNFYSNDVDWLATEYWSEYADVPNQNPSNFRNDTYDGWRNQLLYGTTYEEIYEASAEMQKILQYNVPRLVVYVNTYPQAYRTDKFTGHVEDLGSYISGLWTMRNIHKIDGTFGGSVPVAISEGICSFNIFIMESAYCENALLEYLWPSLYKYGPDLTPWPDLAESMLTETHSDNPAVPVGHTRFTVDIIHNATWSDGVPLTANDVAFTYNYAVESGVFGNPAAVNLNYLVAAYAPSTYRVVVEFSTESYWHFSDFAFDYIIPYHIFNDDTGIGYEGWNTWNPVFDPAEPHVNCGPFIVLEFDKDNYYTLQRNPLFHYAAITDPVIDPTTTAITYTTTSSTSTTTISDTSTSSGTGQFPGVGASLSLAVSSIVGSFSAVVIIYCLFHIIKNNKPWRVR